MLRTSSKGLTMEENALTGRRFVRGGFRFQALYPRGKSGWPASGAYCILTK
jgi:hypothetical protein